jgi:hypothetical protein
MTEFIDVIMRLSSALGPVGVFCLLAGVLLVQLSRTKSYHLVNSEKLDTIALTSATASNASAETLRIVNLMNGRLIRLEEWRTLHDTNDNNRFDRLENVLSKHNQL